MNSAPIGIFDSGLGGLSVWHQLQKQLPDESFLYVADQGHVPYGPRSDQEIIAFSQGISQFLLAHQTKAIVVACNRASAAALTHLRQTWPNVPFIGMEPAVKPAAQQTESGKIGVLATVGTLESERYATLMARFGQRITVYEDPCAGLVDLIEAGKTDAAETRLFLERIVQPMVAKGVDTLVLGCTHYPFIRPLLQQIAPQLHIIDPAPAVAEQTKRVLAQAGLLATQPQAKQLQFVTTTRTTPFVRLIWQLVGHQTEVKQAVWHGLQLQAA